jgi:RimJ/RimL family protein N-acetyltransferase
VAIQLDVDVTTTELRKPIEGSKVLLICPEEKDSRFLFRCYQDYNFMRLYRSWHTQKHFSEERIKEQLIEEQKLSPLQIKKIEWIVWRKYINTKVPVGLAGLVDYHAVNKQTEFTIGLLDEYRKSGMGFEASLLIFDFAFNTLDLNKLASIVYWYNKEAQKSTLKLGFTQEGVLRKHHWDEHDRQLIDVYYNGLLQEEFRSSKRLSRASKRLLDRDVTQKDRLFQTLDQAKIKQIKNLFKEAYKGALSND